MQSTWSWTILFVMALFVGIRLVKFLPEREFRIFTTAVTIVSVLIMILT